MHFSTVLLSVVVGRVHKGLTNMNFGYVKIHGQESNTLQVCNLNRFLTECHIQKRAFPMYFFRFLLWWLNTLTNLSSQIR